MQPLFIRIENTFNEAMYFRDAPDMVKGAMYFGGVQLIPNNPQPYTQLTRATEGVELEEYTVTVKDMCGNTLGDITDSFSVDSVYNDGLPQISWSLTNVQADFGLQMVYLEIQQLPAGNTYYSSPFMLTSEEQEYVSRWDYWNDNISDIRLSTGLRLWFKQYADVESITTYTPVSGAYQMSHSNISEVEQWQTSLMELNIFRLIKHMRNCIYVYCDGQRTMPNDALETPQRSGGENFGEATLLLVRNPYDTYDPLYVPVVPPPPTPTYSIVLESVVAPNPNTVTYTFSFVGFDPGYSVVEYSLDGINWVQNTGQVQSPRNVIIPQPLENDYYYRVSYPPLGIVSNVLQLPNQQLTITDVQQVSGNKFAVNYTTTGFTQSESIIVEISTTGDVWQTAIQSEVIQNPKLVLRPNQLPAFTYFRAKYLPLGLTSNVFEI